MTDQLTKAQRKALERASEREGGYVCPIPGLHGEAEEMLIQSLDRRKLINWDGGAPYINEAGLAAIGH